MAVEDDYSRPQMRGYRNHGGGYSGIERQHYHHHHPHHHHHHHHHHELRHQVRELKLKERIRHFTWTWFTMTMATGGIANVLAHVPYRFHGLYTIGCIFFILNLILFVFNVTMISLRFYYYPKTFVASVKHPTESLFIPASLISVGTILLNITEYGTAPGKAGPWLSHVMEALFWVYCVLAVVFSSGIYLVMWSTQTYTIAQMTPVWIFPAYPLLVVGPHASVLVERLQGDRALDIIVGGFIFQGIGFLVSLLIYAAFIYRLMTHKLPQESRRPGMFISIGPSGFTIAGVMGMGRHLPRVVNPNFMGEGMGEFAANVSLVAANWMGLWLWGLAWWFFLVSVGAHWSTVRHGRGKFAMTYYSYIFPNTALTTATFAVGKALDSRAIRIIGCVMSCLLIVAWAAVFVMMIRAVIVKDILWPQKQEDRAEGGWRESPDERVPYDSPPFSPSPASAERVVSSMSSADRVSNQHGVGLINGNGMADVIADGVTDQPEANGSVRPKGPEEVV